MGRPYQDELESLGLTYKAAISFDVDPVINVLAKARGLPLIAIGSGGSFTAAHFMAALHEQCCRTVARAATPLDATRFTSTGLDLAIMLITAGGSNPDVLGIFKQLAAVEPAKLMVLCAKAGSKLASQAFRHSYVDLLELVTPAGKDGFLAANSLLWLTTCLARAYGGLAGGSSELPNSLDSLLNIGASHGTFVPSLLKKCSPLWARQTLIVLHGPETASAAIDLESKFTEAALGVVQVADFRSFAHGRHHWLAKHGDTSSVLALATKADHELASRTLGLLPATTPTSLISVPGKDVSASLAALVIGFYIAGFAGIARRIDPGRPGVPAFGRKLYNLRTFHRRVVPHATADPMLAVAIERKAGLSVERLKDRGEYKHWHNAYRAFLSRLHAARFSSVVLDYDGTLCDADERQNGLQTQAANALIRIAQAGLTIGIVTGRGKSVRQDLQREIPKNLWDRFIIGYYNGSDIAPLSELTRPQSGGCIGDLAAVAQFLQHDSALSAVCEYEPRPSQIMVKPKHGTSHARILEVLQDAIAQTSSRATVVRSGHSFDILAEGVSKRAIFSKLNGDSGGAVLCIGDSGKWPGNDFSLLAHEYSLSAYEVSANQETCWNLAPPGQRGVPVTLGYLNGLVTTRAKGRMAIRLKGHGTRSQ